MPKYSISGSMCTALAVLGLFIGSAGSASAAIETDPQALFQKMNQAYTEGTAEGWTFDAHRYYASAVYATGRSYSLFQHDNPNYASVAALTVQVATKLHFDPLNNDDAAAWWVREAANYTRDHNPAMASDASAILEHMDEADQSYEGAARIAVADAAENVKDFHNDAEARVQEVIVDLRAARFANDASYKLMALAHAASPSFPLVRLPSSDAAVIYQTCLDVENDKNATADDLAHAKSILARRDATPELQEIGHVQAIGHRFHLSITAPADEYFGRQGMSVLGIHNLMKKIDAYLKAGYGAREAGEGKELTEALISLQHTYPRDYELPNLLGDAIRLIGRIPDNGALVDVRDLSHMLIYNYPQTAQAQDLLKQTQSDGASAAGGEQNADNAAPNQPAQAAPAAAHNDAPPRVQPDIAQHPPFRRQIAPPTVVGSPTQP